MKLNSLRTQLGVIFTIGTFVIISILIAYSAITSRNMAMQQAKRKAVAEANYFASEVKAAIEIALDESRALAKALSAVKKDKNALDIDRQDVNSILESVLKSNENFLGVYTLWEPNAFDSLDYMYKNTPTHDETGRFIPYWKRDNGDIVAEPLIDYEFEGPGDYYQIPKKTNEEAVIDPYLYNNVLLMSLVTPISKNNRFYGITGIDYSLEFIQKMTEKAGLYDEKAHVSIVSNSGIYAGHSDKKELIGKSIETVYEEDFAQQVSDIQKGRTRIWNLGDELKVYVPVRFGNSDSFWQVRLTVPMSIITADAQRQMWTNIIIGIVLLLISIVLILLVMSKLTRPINRLVDVAKDISEGNLDTEITINQTNEIGDLADAFGNMQYKLRQKINETRQLQKASEDKAYWYEQILDSIPFPLSVTDMDMNWTFINKAATDVTGKTRDEAIGKQCSNWNADICGTKKCGIACLRRGEKSSFFTQPSLDKDFQVDTSYLEDANGERIGHIELVQDITKSKRAAEYNKNEINRISKNLNLISEGKLDIDSNIQEADEYTKAEHENISFIYKDINVLVDTLIKLTGDMKAMYREQEAGDFEYYLNPEQFKGIYKEAIAGYNQAVKLHVDNILLILGILEHYADGDLDHDLKKLPGKQIVANKIMDKLKSNLENLIKETGILTKAAVEGKLSTRGNTDLFKGGYLEIVQGINNTLDAVISPLNDAASYIDRISKGNIPEKLIQEYKGDFNTIKNNLNLLIDATNNITENAKKVANGDLTIELKNRSENDELMIALSNMVKSIAMVVKEVNIAAGNVSGGSMQISKASQVLSQGASEQAASVEQVSSSIEEMSANIQQNADNAQQTEKIAIKAAKDIEEGNKSVEITVDAMKQIAEKISIIGEIAEKTDLLAINAAIEAARAGESGKGFAVVATEVRKLAERSQAAANEINSVAQSSVKIAEKSGNLLKEIVPDIKNTARLVQEISAASSEQSTNTDQINSAINQLNDVAQQNASSSEEMATSSEELSAQAERLKEVIGYFQLSAKYEQLVRNEQSNLPASIKHDNFNSNDSDNNGGKQGIKIELADDNEDIDDADYSNF